MVAEDPPGPAGGAHDAPDQQSTEEEGVSPSTDPTHFAPTALDLSAGQFRPSPNVLCNDATDYTTG